MAMIDRYASRSLTPKDRAAIAADVARLALDAERYQLLRRGQHWSVVNGIGDVLRADRLDAAIDAARGAAQEPKL